MTRGIGRRVEALERRQGGGPCAECGDDGDTPAAWEVVWADPDGPSEPKWCTTCGRPLESVITWDEPPAVEPRGPRRKETPLA